MNYSLAVRLGAVLFLSSMSVLELQARALDPSKVEIRNEKLADNLYVLSGDGGNIAVLAGADGTLLVDDGLFELSQKLRAAVRIVAEKPVRFVVNTHFHFDHTGGNASLGRDGAVILAHDNLRTRLMTRQVINVGREIVTEPTPHEGLPVVTFEDGLRLHLDNEEIVVRHVDHAHTDGDAFVFFEHANVLHTGDLFMSIGYPFVDAGNGGSLDGIIVGIAQALTLCNDKTRVIPGHGPLVGKAELQAYHDMLVVIRQRVADLVNKGRSLEQVLAANPTREFDERWGKGFWSSQVFIERVFTELSRTQERS